MGEKLQKASDLEEALRLKTTELEQELRHTIDGYEEKLASIASKQSPVVKVQSQVGTKPPPPPSLPPPPEKTETPETLDITPTGKPQDEPPPFRPPLPTKSETSDIPDSMPKEEIEAESSPRTNAENPDTLNIPAKVIFKDEAKSRPVAVEPQPIAKELSKQTKETRKDFSKTWIALSLWLAVMLTHVHLFFSDGTCAPAMPGTVLVSGEDFASEAPWWAPDSLKVPAFQLFCGERPRVQMGFASGKLFLREEQNGKMKTLHKAEGTRAMIKGNGIIIENKKGSQTFISAPWVSSSLQ